MSSNCVFDDWCDIDCDNFALLKKASKKETSAVATLACTPFSHVFLAINTWSRPWSVNDRPWLHFSLKSVPDLFDVRWKVLLGIWHLISYLFMLLQFLRSCFKGAHSRFIKAQSTIVFLIVFILDEQWLLVLLSVCSSRYVALIVWSVLLAILSVIVWKQVREKSFDTFLLLL